MRLRRLGWVSALCVASLVAACRDDDASPGFLEDGGRDASSDTGLGDAGTNDSGAGDASADDASVNDAGMDDAGADAGADTGVCPDVDGDGARSAACGGTDCDDANAARYPGATEVCDAADLDEDCDPETYGFRDGDGDGYPDARCCNGFMCGDDCNDARPGVNPAAPEVCNGGDDDCDGDIDDGVLVMLYPDSDRDGFGAGMPSIGCLCERDLWPRFAQRDGTITSASP